MTDGASTQPGRQFDLYERASHDPTRRGTTVLVPTDAPNRGELAAEALGLRGEDGERAVMTNQRYTDPDLGERDRGVLRRLGGRFGWAGSAVTTAGTLLATGSLAQAAEELPGVDVGRAALEGRECEAGLRALEATTVGLVVAEPARWFGACGDEQDPSVVRTLIDHGDWDRVESTEPWALDDQDDFIAY